MATVDYTTESRVIREVEDIITQLAVPTRANTRELSEER